MTADNFKNLSMYQVVKPGVEGTNLAKAVCPNHTHDGKPVYFERVKDELFQCAHRDHYADGIGYPSTNLPPGVADR